MTAGTAKTTPMSVATALSHTVSGRPGRGSDGSTTTRTLPEIASRPAWVLARLLHQPITGFDLLPQGPGDPDLLLAPVVKADGHSPVEVRPVEQRARLRHHHRVPCL